MRLFFRNLPKRIALMGINHFLNTLDIPKLFTDQIILCEIEFTEKDLYDFMKSMENDKSPKRWFT